MDLQNMDLKGGSLQISTEVIGKIARLQRWRSRVWQRCPAASRTGR